MKFSIIGGLIFLLSGAGALAAVALMNPPAADPPAAPAVAADKQTADASETLVLSVPDMHCEIACAPKVRETLAVVPGVKKVDTNVENQTAMVVAGEGFDIEKALAALDGAGYPAKVAE